MAKRARHPDEFVKEFFHATSVGRVGHFARRRIEQFSCCTEIDVRENCDQAELAQNWHQTLDHACTAERTRRNTANANRFMDVFLQVCIEYMLQQPWETVIVFRDDEDQSVGSRDCCRELVVL